MNITLTYGFRGIFRLVVVVVVVVVVEVVVVDVVVLVVVEVSVVLLFQPQFQLDSVVVVLGKVVVRLHGFQVVV